MIVSNPYYPNIFLDDAGIVFRLRSLEIGVWNMDVTDYVDIIHNLDYLKIRHIEALIRDDTDLSIYHIGVHANIDKEGGIIRITNSNIRLLRWAGGIFDSSVYDDGVMNRGWILIWYTE